MSLRSAAVLVLGLVGCTATTVPPTASPDLTQTPATPSQGPTASPPPSPTERPTLTPTPTATPPPTDAGSPSPGATAATTASPSSAAEGLPVDEADIAAHLDALAEIAAENGGTRAAGEAGYDDSADYVAAQLEGMGYDVTRQPVDFTYFQEAAPISVTIGGESWSGAEWLHANIYSGEGAVSATLETVDIIDGQPTPTGACDDGAWSSFDTGNIAVVMGGTCLRRDVVLLAQDAGAVALVSLYPTWTANRILRPTLLDPDGIDIPAIVAGQEPALALLDAAQTGGQGSISVDVSMSPATGDNVFGEIGSGDGPLVMLGAHLDSSLDGPGVNDNGSGVATLLALAESAAAQPRDDRGIRFAFWSAEELGTIGSSQYVEALSQAEGDRIQAYINLDMVGSINAGRYVYDDDFAASGSAEVTDLITSALDELGAPALRIASGGSDHLAFARAGIVTGGVFSGVAPLSPEEAELFGGQANVLADPCYHLACDDRTNVDTESALIFGQAIAAALEELAF